MKSVLVWQGLGFRRLSEAFDACMATIPAELRKAAAKTLYNTLLYRIEVRDGSDH